MSGANQIVQEIKIFALAQDPIYIGTGGYSIGRVDNTIVRDPITNVPKIPGSSLAGTWRYFVVLEALKELKGNQPKIDDIKNENGNTFGEKLENYNWKNLQNNSKPQEWKEGWKGYKGNQILRITCAGQDNVPQEELSNVDARNKEGKTGHCGHCIVCKGFGFSKKDVSWQGMIFFSDLNILFFPVFTIKGTKWITTASILKEVGIEEKSPSNEKVKIKNVNESQNNNLNTKKVEKNYINLGWLYLEVENEGHSVELNNTQLDSFQLKSEDVVIVPEELFSHIVNSNLEVRTSVSIDPITGASKEGALFTTEAIPRGTIFYGSIRIFDKKAFTGIDKKIEPLPTADCLRQALEDSKHFYETLGIGGMTTRGFGRLKIELKDGSNNICKTTQESSTGGFEND